MESLAQLREHGARFSRAGVRLAAVVQARPGQLAEFCGYSRDFTCIPDPGYGSHGILGIERASFLRILFSGAMYRRRRAAARAGHKQHWGRSFARESDWGLLPAAALIGPDGRFLWVYHGKHPGDLPALDDLLAVAQEHWDPRQSERRRMR